MADKIKMVINWAAACGGCDVSLLDIEAQLLELTKIADVVFWPVALDFKRADLRAMDPGSVDIGLFNGAVRTSAQEEDAKLLRSRCKVLVAYGACASFGGIPGLANLYQRQEILDVAYGTTPSTDNPDGVRPQTESEVDGGLLTLPAFHDAVRSLSQVVEVDVLLPGCPPPTARVLDLVDAAQQYAETGAVPPKGTVLASDKALCDECPRGQSRSPGRIAELVRVHEAIAQPERCFLEQGMLCLGLATRGGCGGSCIAVNMPCRGCFGPTEAMLDPGAEAISAIGSMAGEANENYVQAHQMKKAVRSIRDVAGTFYRFTLPSALIGRAVQDKPQRKEQP